MIEANEEVNSNEFSRKTIESCSVCATWAVLDVIPQKYVWWLVLCANLEGVLGKINI